MSRYLEVFFRHKAPLIGLLALCMLVSTAVVALTPKTYQATASLWFDTGPVPTNTPLVSTQTPADQASATFRELLSTHEFDVNAGRRGPLADYFDSTGNFPSSDPITPLVHWLERKPQPTGQLRTQMVDDGVVLTLQKYVLVIPSEPHVVGLSFNFQDPAIAAGTLQALIDQFQDEVKKAALGTAQSQLDFYNGQVTAQQKVVDEKNAAAAAYAQTHPGANNPLNPDPTYVGLAQDAQLAQQQLASLTKERDQAQVDVASIKQPGPYGFRVVDPPQAPIGATGLLKTVLLGFGGGLGVGLLLIGVICFLLVTADHTALRGRDISRTLNVIIVGEVPLLPLSASPARQPRQLAGPKT